MARQRKKKIEPAVAEVVTEPAPAGGEVATAESSAATRAQNDNGAQSQSQPQSERAGVVTNDARGIDTILLGPSNDSPKMRLLRSNRFKQMQIAFDEKPDEQYRARLHEAGWRWRQAEGLWTVQLEPEHKWRTHADAERLFTEIGNAIRADRGLEPVQQLNR